MQARLADPAVLFSLLSMIFGLAVIAINPPLRGPDESAHFLRIYSVAQGKIVPRDTDERGRRGLMLPAQLHSDFVFFDKLRGDVWYPSAKHEEIVRNFAQARAQRRPETDSPDVFQFYGGSEAYSPAPYLPYIPAAFILQMAGADLVSSVYALRFAGLAAFTAMGAYAIAMTPHLKWAFFLIAMLPTAIYSRAVLSADGLALGTTLVLVALCLRAALKNENARTAERSLWMTLCLLVKPAQVAFLLLEGMTAKLSDHPRRWRALTLIMLPGLFLTALWLVAGSVDVGAWRIAQDTDLSPNEFNPVWKLRFMIQHPLHFPVIALRSLDYSIELWRQLIGVLGWLDTYLVSFAYPVLTLLMLVTWIEMLNASWVIRRRIAFWCGASVLAYILAIFLIFFLIWTPTSADRILGVQGRYFLVMLPPLALLTAAFLNRNLPQRLVMGCAVGGALASGVATIAAILRIS